MKDGTTHLAYKPEHAVDLDAGVIVAAQIHSSDEGDTMTLKPPLDEVEKSLSAIDLAPRRETPCELIADKGYHSRDVLKGLDKGPWKTRIAEPTPANGFLRWHGDVEARAAVYGNRNRLRSGIAKQAMRKRGEIVERSFAHILDHGGMRRTWLRGRQNVHNRYLVHVGGFNLGVLMRARSGRGTPTEAANVSSALLFVIQADVALAVAIVTLIEGNAVILVITIAPETH